MDRIGIYGGTFNPPHIGHIRGAQYALKQLSLKELLLIPSCISPHKVLPEDSASAQQRYEMLRLAVQDMPGMTVSDLELRRGSFSYTYETVEQVRAMYPNAELILFMGTDMFLTLDSWREPWRILKNASVGVLYRGEPGEAAKIRMKKAFFEARGATVYLVENPVTAISSTDLRRMLAFHCAAPFLPNGLEAYIRENGLYRTDEDLKNLSLSQLEQVVTDLIDPKRIDHVLGCRQTALELAQRYGADPIAAQRGALLHDITKALDGALQLTLCREYGITLDEFSRENPKTLHALTGSLVAQRIFGETPEVVAAIASHTTGKAAMCPLEKILYVADYMEPNRDFPGVETLRQLAYTDLDGALELGLRMTLAHLAQQGSTVSPESAQALAYLEKQKSNGKEE